MSLALELGRTGVTVNAIAPGATETGLTVDAYTPAIRGLYEQRIASGLIAQPSDFAGCAVFLASDEASYVTGHELLVDGGLLLNGNVGFAQSPGATHDETKPGLIWSSHPGTDIFLQRGILEP